MIKPLDVFSTFNTANFTHTNVSGITGIPGVITQELANKGSTGAGATARVNGLLVNTREDRAKPINSGDRKSETYVLDFNALFPDDTSYIESMIEYDRIFDINNRNTTQVSEYYYLEYGKAYDLEEVQGTMRVIMDRPFV